MRRRVRGVSVLIRDMYFSINMEQHWTKYWFNQASVWKFNPYIGGTMHDYHHSCIIMTYNGPLWLKVQKVWHNIQQVEIPFRLSPAIRKCEHWLTSVSNFEDRRHKCHYTQKWLMPETSQQWGKVSEYIYSSTVLKWSFEVLVLPSDATLCFHLTTFQRETLDFCTLLCLFDSFGSF